jgi:transposase
MNLVELLQIASSEEKAEEFLREKGILKTFDSCPFCHDRNIGKLGRNFYKCYRCKKEWSVRKDRFLEDLKLHFLNLYGL